MAAPCPGSATPGWFEPGAACCAAIGQGGHLAHTGPTSCRPRRTRLVAVPAGSDVPPAVQPLRLGPYPNDRRAATVEATAPAHIDLTVAGAPPLTRAEADGVKAGGQTRVRTGHPVRRPSVRRTGLITIPKIGCVPPHTVAEGVQPGSPAPTDRQPDQRVRHVGPRLRCGCVRGGAQTARQSRVLRVRARCRHSSAGADAGQGSPCQ
jgi:hypothetical protein